MTTQTIHMRVAVMALCAGMVSAAPAAAQITRGGTTPLSWASRWDVAHDAFNQVFLLLADGHPARRVPVIGQFIDESGNPLGGMFNITDEFADTGEAPSWATVTFGGTPQDPVFLITYLVPLEGGGIPKYGRLVRYRGAAAPLVSGRTLIYPNIGSEWFAADRARPAWNGQRFIVPTRVPGGAVGSVFAQPLFTFFDLNGLSSGGFNMGNALDYQASPSVACGAGNVCMAAGFAAGAPFGGVGGIWARLFDGLTLQPITDVFYPDDHSTFMDTPHVVFNANTGQFNLVWYRRAGAGAIDFRVVTTNGVMGPLDLARSFTIFPGEPGLAYNPVSRSSLLITKWGAGADLYSLELGDDGYPKNLGNGVEITTWDGRTLEYRPAVAASQNGARWVVTFNLAASSGAAFVGGAGTGGALPTNPRMYIDYPAHGSTVSTDFGIAGWALDLSATSGSGVSAVHVWAFPTSGASPVFLGAATLNIPRPDVGAFFQNAQFSSSGYGLGAFLPPGTYDLRVSMFSTVAGGFNLAGVTRVTVVALQPLPRMAVDAPSPHQGVLQSFEISGWAVDLASTSGTGVAAVHVWAYPTSGASPIWVGAGNLGGHRPDVGAYYGDPRFSSSGYSLQGALPPGTYYLVVFAQSTVTGTFNQATLVPITVQ